MAIGAFIPTGMLVQHLRSPTEGPSMACPTSLPFIGGKQTRPVADMGVVTGLTGIAAFGALQMAMGMIKSRQHIFMAAQTGIRSLLAPVASLTVPLGERLMLDFSQQGFFLAAMGMMTAQAIEIAGIPAEMGFFHGRFGLMATEAEFAAGGLQQTEIRTAMRIVTGIALSRFEGLVHLRKRLFHLLVTGETELAAFFVQQSRVGGNMGSMAALAGPFLDRLMESGVALYPFFRLLVATEAERLLILQQQSLVTGHVRTVALFATVLRNRRMDHLATKIRTVMAIETGGSKPQGSVPHNPAQTHRKSDQRNQYMSFHYRPPG